MHGMAWGKATERRVLTVKLSKKKPMQGPRKVKLQF